MKINQSNRGDFQTVVLIISGVLILAAVLIFSGIIPGFGGIGGKNVVKTDLVIWGTAPKDVFSKALGDFNQAYPKNYSLTYVEHNPGSYEQDLLEALAAGTGPDIFMINQQMIAKQKNKIFVWPTQYYTERSFKDAFADDAELFWQPNGALALPIFIDPLVLYWNKELFASKGIAQPPTTWEEFQNVSKQLTSLDKNGNIAFSGAAMGLFTNINNAKDIISALILQTGNPIINQDQGKLVSALSDRASQDAVTGAMDFFTRFSNVRFDAYSWNYAMPNSTDVFTAGNLAMYLGFGSETGNIKGKNPHLNFDLAVIPQLGSQNLHTTMSNVYALAISKNISAAKLPGAMGALLIFTGPDFLKDLAESNSFAPSRRDLLAQEPASAEKAVLYKSAVLARSWPDPDPQQTYSIFKEMVESIVSGKRKPSDAVGDMQLKFKTLTQ